MRNEYNAETPMNVLTTALFVTGAVLHKEGYKIEDIQRLLETIGVTVNAIFNGSAQITSNGISLVEKPLELEKPQVNSSNVVNLSYPNEK